MSDPLLKLSASPSARRLVRMLRLPVALPQTLRRPAGPLSSAPLEGRAVCVTGATHPFADTASARFTAAGAAMQAEGELDVLTLVATDVDTREGLDALYEQAHARIRDVKKNGRVIVAGLAPDNAPSPAAQARRAALNGFTRSLAKELGRRGATANYVVITDDAEAEAAEVALFLASDAASFITGQPWRVGPTATLAPWSHRALDGKTAVVTGAARGIGNAIAYGLSRAGARVIGVDRPSAELDQVARGVEGVAIGADVRDPSLVDQIREAAGDHGVDIYVPNAGVTRDRTLGRMSREEWDLVLDVNLDAVVSSTTELLADGLRPNARVVLVASVGGIAGMPGQTNYGATKAGVIGLARGLAAELSGRGGSINAVAPGFIETAMTAQMPAMNRFGARRLSVLGQGGLPVDIARAVTFLASDAAAGVNGQCLRVCGGNLVGA